MGRVFVAVGSNIDPERRVAGALKLLGTKVPILAVSTFYKTEPVGRANSPLYINGVIELSTDLAPVELKLNLLRTVEARFGRVRSEDKNLPRTIDLDLILHGDTVINEDGLVLPDPDITARAFILLPLYELYPELVLPGTEVKIAELAGKVMKREEGDETQSGGTPQMEVLAEFTQRLRRELGL